MKLDEDTVFFYSLILPHYLNEVQQAERENSRFVHYTSSEVAHSILRDEKIWLRNVTTMNDFSEIRYGIGLVNQALDGKIGDDFKQVIDDIFPSTYEKVLDFINRWIEDWIHETYIACVSIHDTSEDYDGRLSMWRAYGDTALVIKNTPLVQPTDLLSVYSAPVRYLNYDDYQAILLETIDAIRNNKLKLIEKGQQYLVDCIYQLFFITAITTKHPGFKEEKEWRLYYRPQEKSNDLLEAEQVVVKGVPQQIFKLPLDHLPDRGLFHADIPSLLDRIIIGPTQYPVVATKAYSTLLGGAWCRKSR